MKIGSLEVGAGEPCALVAEIGNAHGQDEARAYRLLDAAKACGASAAKLQCYSVEELIALRGDGPAPPPWDALSMRGLYERAMTPRAWFPRLFDYARSIDLPLFSSVFGLESLALLESCGNPVYKIAKPERHNVALLDACWGTHKSVLISVPNEGYTVSPPEALLYCPGGYPCALEDVQLPVFTGHYLGLSLHVMSGDVILLAVARGAKLIEVHFELAAEPGPFEHDLSYTEVQLAQIIPKIRTAEALLAP
jgi:sialic acid synthase SpsE